MWSRLYRTMYGKSIKITLCEQNNIKKENIEDSVDNVGVIRFLWKK